MTTKLPGKQNNIKTGNAAKSAVNQLLTLRNWVIGYYIVEYEQGGKDRAEYGAAILDKLEDRINEKGLNKTLFKWCRQFYNMYPQIGATASHQLGVLIDSQRISTVSNEFVTKPEMLVKRLSFSHIREIMVLEDEFERFFYETECIKCGWSVRELRRQIKTNLYFRSGVSKNPRELLKSSENKIDGYTFSIKDPFTFEFLGLDDNGFLNESDLEQALIDHFLY